MKEILSNINKAFENRIRLGIMSVLMANESMDFTGLRDILDVTDGNLSSHLRALEEAGYVIAEKRFLGRKPNTTYTITNSGSDSFRNHLSALEELLAKN
jgi:DNA-binding transcriptional ArsR family regulator